MQRLSNDELLTALGIDHSCYPPQKKLHIIHILAHAANASRNLVLCDSSRRYSLYLGSELHLAGNVDKVVEEVITSVSFPLFSSG